jgi:hypothetical protein
MTVLGEPMFANVLLRFDSIQVEEILAIMNVGNSWSRRRHKYTQCPLRPLELAASGSDMFDL